MDQLESFMGLVLCFSFTFVFCAYGDFQAVNGQNINNCFPPSCQQ